jgi:hypothetical protein
LLNESLPILSGDTVAVSAGRRAASKTNKINIMAGKVSMIWRAKFARGAGHEFSPDREVVDLKVDLDIRKGGSRM